ncbi:hypothetical protein TSUD_238880 [Trifolium subterraneum]|uniref:Uncharacterized protein n=1 Tax=Trifolium subterraneum TaxID=3900 RepID=A0A2Z6P1J8_TRISU|nr:hypothetical protein TSUD_238880 [Trifolium subterraneum]
MHGKETPFPLRNGDITPLRRRISQTYGDGVISPIRGRVETFFGLSPGGRDYSLAKTYLRRPAVFAFLLLLLSSSLCPCQWLAKRFTQKKKKFNPPFIILSKYSTTPDLNMGLKGIAQTYIQDINSGFRQVSFRFYHILLSFQ